MTAQIPDTILIDGQARAFFSERLNACYGDAPRPNSVPQNTANWRGYVGTWEIREGRLYLIGIVAEICHLPLGWNCPQDQRRKVGVDDLFPRRGDSILADWFSGTLRVPVGGQPQCRHWGYESIHEFDLVVTIEKGVVKSTTTVDNRKARRRCGRQTRRPVFPAVTRTARYFGFAIPVITAAAVDLQADVRLDEMDALLHLKSRGGSWLRNLASQQ